MDYLYEHTEQLIIWAIVGMFFIPIVLLSTISNIGKSSGVHAGIVTAVETNSFIATNQRAYFKTSSESTQEDTYCIQDQSVYDTLVEKSESGEKVKIKFTHPLIEWSWNCSGEVGIITEVY